MKGFKTHFAKSVEVVSTWKSRDKKKSEILIEDLQFCTGEIIKRPSYWMFQDSILTKRWKNVTCKNCLNLRGKR